MAFLGDLENWWRLLFEMNWAPGGVISCGLRMVRGSYTDGRRRNRRRSTGLYGVLLMVRLSVLKQMIKKGWQTSRSHPFLIQFSSLWFIDDLWRQPNGSIIIG